MLFWHYSERVCQKFEMEDYKRHGAEYVLYKSSRAFFPLFIPRSMVVVFFVFFSQRILKKSHCWGLFLAATFLHQRHVVFVGTQR